MCWISPVSLSAAQEGRSVVSLSSYNTLLRQRVFNKRMNSPSPLQVVMHSLGQNESVAASVPCKDHTHDTHTDAPGTELSVIMVHWYHASQYLPHTKGRYSLLLHEKDAQNTEQKMSNGKSKRSFEWVPCMSSALHTRLCAETAGGQLNYNLSFCPLFVVKGFQFTNKLKKIIQWDSFPFLTTYVQQFNQTEICLWRTIFF